MGHLAHMYHARRPHGSEHGLLPTSTSGTRRNCAVSPICRSQKCGGGSICYIYRGRAVPYDRKVHPTDVVLAQRFLWDDAAPSTLRSKSVLPLLSSDAEMATARYELHGGPNVPGVIQPGHYFKVSCPTRQVTRAERGGETKGLTTGLHHNNWRLPNSRAPRT